MTRIGERPLFRAAAVALLLLATVAFYCAVCFVARIVVLGRPGVHYVIKKSNGQIEREGRAPYSIAPDCIPRPALGDTLVISGTFLARSSGRYTWSVGAATRSRFFVDGDLLFEPAPGLLRTREQWLGAGPHFVVAEIVADDEGSLAIAVREPGIFARVHLLSTSDTVDATPAEFLRRVGGHFRFAISSLQLAPALLSLIVALCAALAFRSKRLREDIALYFADRAVQQVAVAAMLAAIIAPMVVPLLQPGFYFCHEGEGYAIRLTQYRTAIEAGVPLGRWWPDPVFGRGYPFLCLYAPLLYLVSTPFLLLGLSSLSTVKLITAAAVVSACIGLYRLARRAQASRPAALMATALLCYAPYLQTDVWVRADLAECLAFPMFVLTLNALDRVLDRRFAELRTKYQRGSDIGLLALSLAGLGCAHNIIAYSSAYFLTLWLSIRWLIGFTNRQGIARALIAAFLGFLLTVFYSVPALNDVQRVWIQRILSGYYDPFRNILTWYDAFWSKPRWDMRTYIGIADDLFIVIAAGLLLYSRLLSAPRAARPVRALAICGVAGVALSVALMCRPTAGYFLRYVPLAHNIQFPWRLFLFAACLAPLCAPMVIDSIRPARLRWALSVVGIVALMISALTSYGPSAPLVRVHVREREFLRRIETDYVTSMNEYLPKTVRRTVPQFGDVAHIVEGNGRLTDASTTPGQYAITVDAKTPVVAELNAHWFPGWRADVDGRAASIGPGTESFDDGGLIRVRVPAGVHRVEIRYSRTGLRALCDGVTAATLVIVLGLILTPLFRSRRMAAART